MMEINLHINKNPNPTQLKKKIHMIYILTSMKYVGNSICCFFFVFFFKCMLHTMGC